MQESTPKVSLIICVYNGELYLKEAIESALAGIQEDVEIICVDDGSSDSSGRIAKEFSDRLSHYSLPHRGLPASRNAAIDLARGEFLAFLDADDLFVEGRLACQLAAFEGNPALDMVFGYVKQFISPEITEDVRNNIRCQTEAEPGRYIGTMLIRRESFLRVGPFDTASQVAYFLEWYARAMERGLKEELIPHLVVLRRIHTSNLGITDRSSFAADHARVIKAVLDRRRQAMNRSSGLR